MFARGTVLSVTFAVTRNGALYDPSPLPTMQYALQPDGTNIGAPTLTRVAAGIFTGDIFDANDTADQEGTYEAAAYTSDPLVDGDGRTLMQWIVDDILATIEAKTNLIGNGVLIVQAPVAVDGLTRLTAGSSYTNADGNALVYTVTGYPDFDIGAPAYWHATNKSGGATKITGIVTAVGELTFEVTAAQSRKLKTGVYALYTTSDNDNPLVMPNNTLVVDEAI